MVDATLVRAIRLALRKHEIGDATPYQIAFACRDNSGGSFGTFQNDVRQNPRAKAALFDVLRRAAVGPERAEHLVETLAQDCSGGNPLTEAETDIVDSALSRPAGRQVVDALDESIFVGILKKLETTVGVAARRGLTLSNEALLFLALWIGATGSAEPVPAWIDGGTVGGVLAPVGPVVEAAEISVCLKAQTHYRQNPSKFTRLVVAARVGAVRLGADPRMKPRARRLETV